MMIFFSNNIFLPSFLIVIAYQTFAWAVSPTFSRKAHKRNESSVTTQECNFQNLQEKLEETNKTESDSKSNAYKSKVFFKTNLDKVRAFALKKILEADNV